MIHIGLGYWHKQFRTEVKQTAGYFMANPQGTPNFAYPYELSSIELQLGGIRRITSLIREEIPFSKAYLGHEARLDRMNHFDSRFHNAHSSGRQTQAYMLAEQQALDNLLERAYGKPFTGVHSTDGTKIGHYKIKNDLSDPDPAHQEVIIQTHAQMMELAHIMDANAYVLHLTCWDTWLGQDLKNRKERINGAFERFKILMDIYREKKYHFPIALENLEFSKFPATLEELWFAWNSCRYIAQERGVNPGNIKMCLDFQHLRHSYKIINEPGNYNEYGGQRRIDSDNWGDFSKVLLPGFFQVHQKVIGTQWNEHTKKRHSGIDIARQFLEHNIANILVVHTAGNNHISATQDPIYYQPIDQKIPPWQLDCRLMSNMLIDCGFDGAITVEDQSPNYTQHEKSALVILQYLKERES